MILYWLQCCENALLCRFWVVKDSKGEINLFRSYFKRNLFFQLTTSTSTSAASSTGCGKWQQPHFENVVNCGMNLFVRLNICYTELLLPFFACYLLVSLSISNRCCDTLTDKYKIACCLAGDLRMAFFTMKLDLTLGE